VRVYSGPTKVKVCDRLGDDWRRLADFFEVRPAERARFPVGFEPQSLWELLEQRELLDGLPDGLREIRRPDLADVLLADGTRPRSAVLSAADDPAARFRLLDTAFFDLNEIRNVIEEVLEEAPGPVAFVATRPEEMFVLKLCEWLEHSVDDIQQRPAVSLNPLQGGIERALAHIETLRPVLRVSSIVCRVNIHSPEVMPADVMRFWTEIRGRFRDIDRWLLLLIQIHAAEMPLDGIVSLPAPRFAREHVRDWGRSLLITLQWPPRLVRPLTEAVVTFARTAGELDVRLVYDALGGVVYDVRHEPDRVRSELERGSYVAHAAQN
jgi:hypothetical protein